MLDEQSAKELEYITGLVDAGYLAINNAVTRLDTLVADMDNPPTNLSDTLKTLEMIEDRLEKIKH